MSLIVTRQSFAAREKIAAQVKSRKQAATVEKQIAREQGDLRENAGFAEAKREIALAGRRLSELELDRPDLMIINPEEWCRIDMMGEPNAQVGAVVTIQRGESPTLETYIIGGAWDGDLDDAPAKWDMQPERLPYTSPLARLLIPHDVGFKGELSTSREIIHLKNARPPTREEINHLYQEMPVKKKEKAEPAMEM